MKLKQEVIEKIKKSQRCITLLCLTNSCTEANVRRWLQINYVMLTTADSLNTISSELNIPVSDLTEKTA